MGKYPCVQMNSRAAKAKPAPKANGGCGSCNSKYVHPMDNAALSCNRSGYDYAGTSCGYKGHIKSSVGMDCADNTDYDDCHPFDDILITEPRSNIYGDCFRGYHTFVTTNFNQTRDLRGDIPVGACSSGPCGESSCGAGPQGASVSSHYNVALKPYRGFVY